MRYVLVLIFAVLCLPSYAAPVYRWVDETGKVQYSDKPPAGQSKALMELDKSGRIRKGNEPQLSPVEKAELEEKKKAEQERRRTDKALLQSFSKPEEIDLLRDRQVEAVQAGIQTNRLRREAVIKRADQQQQQVQRLQKSKRAVPADLQAGIDVSQKEIEDIDKLLMAQQNEIVMIHDRAATQKKRFIELKNVQPN
ncbi:DUF4124 domain-containing protein [Deefgea tanakiae]|jgi:hypothetical protein|uniref:DUF4124 domain-containing protein n=1 Tax=Deefgea tanakiae TaxID=2865840 RepID=A0ABX8Z9V4_9NEIS|nr:DUF4124 domain-containing protein [Deefgea tanakiae]QZA77644.1 DUF4124 domain-containing protein [Deefgea tanakiae]